MSKSLNTKLCASAAFMVTALIAALVPTPPANAATASSQSSYVAGQNVVVDGVRVQSH